MRHDSDCLSALVPQVRDDGERSKMVKDFMLLSDVIAIMVLNFIVVDLTEAEDIIYYLFEAHFYKCKRKLHWIFHY